MEDSLPTLLSSHRAALSTLYTALSPLPLPLLAAEESALLLQIKQCTQSQLVLAQSLLSTARTTLEERTTLLGRWRDALGEVGARQVGRGSVLGMLDETDSLLAGLKARVKQRAESILSLQRKLSGFGEVLGRDWLGVLLEEENDGWEGLDLRIERLSELEREVLRCEDELTNRREVINFNLNEIFAIRAELGIHQQYSPSTNSASVSTSTTYSKDRANQPMEDPFDEEILCHLGVGDERIQRKMQPTEENLLRVEAKRKWLEEEKEHRNLLIQSTYDKLHPLWSMLGVSDTEMESFVERWMGSTGDVIVAYQTELARMMTLKRSNLASFIQRERESLTTLWDTLYLSHAQRLSLFPPFYISISPPSTSASNPPSNSTSPAISPNVSEELLVAHEREREKSELVIEESKAILGRLRRYFEVVEEGRELERSAGDPGRLLGKGSRGDPGRLLREEKARKRVGKEGPKLEAELRQIIPLWEKENGKPFLVNGVRFIDSLDEKIEADLAEKEAKKRAKNPLTASSTASSNTRTIPLKPSHTGSSSSTILRAQNTGNSTTLRAQNTGNSTSSLKRQNTGNSTRSTGTTGGGGKKLVMSHTGGSVRSTTTTGTMGGKKVLGEIGNHSVGTGAGAGSTGALGGSGGGAGVGVGGRSGMKVPIGWGGDSTHFASSASVPASTMNGTVSGIGGAGVGVGGGGGGGGGGFRPRSSADILNSSSS